MSEASSTDATCRREFGKTLLDWEKRLGTIFKNDLTLRLNYFQKINVKIREHFGSRVKIN